MADNRYVVMVKPVPIDTLAVLNVGANTPSGTELQVNFIQDPSNLSETQTYLMPPSGENWLLYGITLPQASTVSGIDGFFSFEVNNIPQLTMYGPLSQTPRNLLSRASLAGKEIAIPSLSRLTSNFYATKASTNTVTVSEYVIVSFMRVPNGYSGTVEIPPQ